jgi:hypothetical protein
MDTDREASGTYHSERPKPQGPKLPLDVTGPKLPRLVQSVAASRCYNCSTTLPQDADFRGNCPKCHAALHCCKQCAHFEPSTRFQCRKPVPIRIAVKDQMNECALFSPRVTVARDAVAPSNGASRPDPARAMPAPRSADDARAAFDSLFKK